MCSTCSTANLLKDAVESRRMPSGEPLTPEAIELYAQAADQLEDLLSDPD